MPSTKRFAGTATAIAQVNTFSFVGPFLTNETITFTYGNRSWTYTLTSGTIATFLPLLVTAYNALSSVLYPEAFEQTLANPGAGTTLTLTSKSAGRPFVVAVSTNSAGGTINGGASTGGTATTVSSGGNDWSVSSNWLPIGVPANGDTVDLSGLTIDILYGLDQHTVTLALLKDDLARTGMIGLPDLNASGNYSEYRDTRLKIGATLANITGLSGRTRIDFYSIQTACTIANAATPTDPDVAYAVDLAGTHASNTLAVSKATITSSMVLSTLSVSYSNVNTQNTDVVMLQTGTVGTVTQSGGTLTCTGNISTTWTVTGGIPYLGGTATAAAVKVLTLANKPLSFFWVGTGTITTYTGSEGSTLDTSTVLSPRTCTNSNLDKGAIINDPGNASGQGITFTNPTYLRACGLQDVTINRGRDIHVQL